VDLTFFAQVIVSGLATGAVYALVGMGYTVVFSSTRIFNLAQGQALMLGIMFTWQLRQDWGWPTPIAIVTAAVAAAAVNVLVERVAVAPLRPNRNFNVLLATLVTTIGASTVIGGLAVVVWGVNAKPFSPYFGARGLDVGGVTITAQQVLMVGMALLIAFAYHLFATRTRWGTALVAMSDDPEAAALRGVPVSRARMLAFGLAGLISALGGIVIAPVVFADPNVGLDFGLKGFVAIAVGGFGSMSGAVAGGMVLGVSEAVTANYWNDQYRPLAGLFLVLVILLLRPQGLLGRQRVREV
jgi:branched-chain amino acid transport system permease protein